MQSFQEKLIVKREDFSGIKRTSPNSISSKIIEAKFCDNPYGKLDDLRKKMLIKSNWLCNLNKEH